MDHIHPHLHAYFEDHVPPILDEATYKDFMAEINPNNLPHRDYAPLIKYVKIVGIKGDTMKYFVPNSYNGWNTYIQWVDWEEQKRDLSLTAPEVARLLLWGSNIRVHCPCPSFKFWGSQYILTQLDAAIIPEVRFPHIRNPHLKGIVCKHLNRSIKVTAWHLSDMSAAIKEQRKSL
jgi:hypothetical protein